MTAMSDLTQDLIEEILRRVQVTSLGAVRCTCKEWNAFSKDRSLCKAQAKQKCLGFVTKDYRFCSMRFNLHGILKEDGEDLVEPSIKEIGNLLNKVKISQAYYCEGLLLCVTYDSSLVIWNPYLGQIRWIQLINKKTKGEGKYAFGYDESKNHKILRCFKFNKDYYEIYDLKSNSWKVFNVIPKWDIDYNRRGASVNGNTYFWATESKVVEGYDSDEDDDEDEVEPPFFLICFDFKTERFGQFLPLPFQNCSEDTGIISCVKDEKLAALSQRSYTSLIEIWITTKIEPNEVLWIPFLNVDIEPLVGSNFQFVDNDRNFFIDEEKKVAVVFDFRIGFGFEESESYAYIIGKNEYLKKLTLGGDVKYYGPLLCSSSYVPSLVQIDQIARQKKRERKRKWRNKRKEKKRMKHELNQMV